MATRLKKRSKLKMAKKKIDLVASKYDQKLAFEIETGKNSLEQIIENLSKCLLAGYDRIYLVATNRFAWKRLYQSLLSYLYYLPHLRLVLFQNKSQYKNAYHPL